MKKFTVILLALQLALPLPIFAQEIEPPPRILINEILPDPLENDGENEFIEFYNAGDIEVDLAGWSVDDSRLEDSTLYVFPENESSTRLLPGNFRVLTRPESGLTLNNDFDQVHLYDPLGNEVDFFDFESPRPGRSIGRNANNRDEWLIFSAPSPGNENFAVNNLPVPVIEIQKDTRHMKLNVTGSNSYDPDNDQLTFLWEFEEGVFDERENPLIYEYTTPGEKIVKLTLTDEFGEFVESTITFNASAKSSDSEPPPEVVKNYPKHKLINEFMPSPEGKDAENEWIELYNDRSKTIDLSGWYLDDDEGKSRSYRIPDGMKLRGYDYILFRAYDLKLSLKNSEDVVRLLDPNKNVTQQVRYSDVKENWSYARNIDGSFVWVDTPTPKAENEFPDPPKEYEAGSIVFDSVLPNPEGQDSDNEKILLKNLSSEDIDLEDWSLEDASSKTYKFDDDQIFSGDVLELVSSDFKLTLNNSDETLFLYDPAGNLIDEITWKSSSSGAWLLNPKSLSDSIEVKVARVIDGDTFVGLWDGRPLRMRLIGVDTPETVHPFKPIEYFGRQATSFLEDKLLDRVLRIEFDENKIDKYGRVLVYAHVDDLFMNAEIIKQGFGHAYTKYPFIFYDDFIRYEEEASLAGLGIWQNQKVKSVLKSEPIEEELVEEREPEIEESVLISLKEVPEENSLEEEIMAEPEPILNCHSDHLKIDSLRPYAEKGVTMEFVRLINTGPETVCLQGWRLDDVLDGGSKPFVINGGSIAAGGIRNFRKLETKISLNNKDDCANLIDQDGVVKDTICYGLAHKNEIFTHAGGDWFPKKRSSRKSNKSKASRYSFKRGLLSYQSELPVASYVGTFVSMDEIQELITIELAEGRILEASYASSPINVSMAMQLIDVGNPIELKIYESGDTKNLVSLAAVETSKKDSQNDPDYLLAFSILIASLGLAYKAVAQPSRGSS